jgi:hypothetical protein
MPANYQLTIISSETTKILCYGKIIPAGHSKQIHKL